MTNLLLKGAAEPWIGRTVDWRQRIGSAFHFTCGDGISGRSQVAKNTNTLPKSNKIHAALCLFLFITNLGYLPQLITTMEYGMQSATRNIDLKLGI
jgi:hypothetical protein